MSTPFDNPLIILFLRGKLCRNGPVPRGNSEIIRPLQICDSQKFYEFYFLGFHGIFDALTFRAQPVVLCTAWASNTQNHGQGTRIAKMGAVVWPKIPHMTPRIQDF